VVKGKNIGAIFEALVVKKYWPSHLEDSFAFSMGGFSLPRHPIFRGVTEIVAQVSFL
jgi:hypothetical protein